MYGNILARCGGSGYSVSCRGVNTITSRSSSSSSSTTTRRSNNNNRSIMAATTSAGVACTMCHSLRITAACSAGNSLQQHVRSNLSNNHHSNTTARSLTTSYDNNKAHFGNGMNQTVAWNSTLANNGGGLLKTSSSLLNNNRVIINSSSQIKSNPLQLPCSTFGITQNSLTVAPLSTVALSSQEALLNGESSAAESSWTMQELVGAILFATAATAGSILLGPIDRLRGKTTANNGGGGGNGGDNGGGSGGPIGEHRLDSPLNTKEENKEEGDQEMELGLGVATLPRPYEGKSVNMCMCLLT